MVYMPADSSVYGVVLEEKNCANLDGLKGTF